MSSFSWFGLYYKKSYISTSDSKNIIKNIWAIFIEKLLVIFVELSPETRGGTSPHPFKGRSAHDHVALFLL